MEITVQFEAQLRHVAEVSQAKIIVPNGSSVADVLQEIATQFGPALGGRLVAADGTAQGSVLLFVNDKPVAHSAVTSCRLKEGDLLLLYPPISGG